MKKFIKNNLLGFILGAIIFSGIGAYAEYIISADKIEYAPNISVKDKIDDLYTKAIPTYSGSTTVLPGDNSTILETKNMNLNKNITIEAIPDSYKELASLTNELISSDLLYNKRAYNSNGQMIVGSNRADCEYSSYYCGSACSGSAGVTILNYVPTIYISNYKNVRSNAQFFDYKYSNSYYTITTSPSLSLSTSYKLNDFYDTSTGKLIAKNWGSDYNGQTIYYMACR